jgi:hypothetical protein
MPRTHLAALTLCLCAAAAPAIVADVRTQEKTQTKFEGTLGKVVNFFAGKAAKEGITTTVAVKGDRMARFGENEGQIIDLAEEKVYALDMKKKSYHVVTFAEMRRQMEEARKKAEEDMKKAQAEAAKNDKTAPPEPDAKEPQVEIDFDVKETGQKKTLNGFDTKEVVMTIALREKGKTLEQGGGLVMTSDMWITPNVPAMKEILDFQLRYMKQLAGPQTFGVPVEQMQAAIAAHPMLKQGLARMAEEGRKMEGTPILNVMTMDAVKSAEQLAAEQNQKAEETKSSSASAPPTSVGGLLGGFGKKIAQKKVEGDKPPAAGPQARATFMTITNERLSIATSVAASDVAIPAGFNEDK